MPACRIVSVRRAFGVSAADARRAFWLSLEYDPDPYRTTFNKKADLVERREEFARITMGDAIVRLRVIPPLRKAWAANSRLWASRGIQSQALSDAGNASTGEDHQLRQGADGRSENGIKGAQER